MVWDRKKPGHTFRSVTFFMQKNNIRIFASDTASISSGWAILDIYFEKNKPKIKYIDSGKIKLPFNIGFNKRIKIFYKELKILGKKYLSDFDGEINLAIEDVFIGTNPSSGLKLAKLHGIVMYMVLEFDSDINYYHPTTIKKVITGDAAASKKQVNRCVTKSLGIPLFSDSDNDKSDACAVGMTHALFKFRPKGSNDKR